MRGTLLTLLLLLAIITAAPGGRAAQMFAGESPAGHVVLAPPKRYATNPAFALAQIQVERFAWPLAALLRCPDQAADLARGVAEIGRRVGDVDATLRHAGDARPDEAPAAAHLAAAVAAQRPRFARGDPASCNDARLDLFFALSFGWNDAATLLRQWR